MLSVGSRAQVWHGTAKATGYGRKALRKGDLRKNKHGRLVSRRMSARAKRENRLGRAGWKTRRGVFGSYHVDEKHRGKRRGTQKRRGTRKRRRRKGRRCRHKSGSKKGKYKKC
jgi:hypothetical protein